VEFNDVSDLAAIDIDEELIANLRELSSSPYWTGAPGRHQIAR
jgi:hypothetical protein